MKPIRVVGNILILLASPVWCLPVLLYGFFVLPDFRKAKRGESWIF